MPSPLADDSESFKGYDAKGMRKAVDAKLAELDGKGKKARSANSSNARGVRNTIRQAEGILLAEELLRRFKVDQRRKNDRERQQRHRAKVSRQKA